MAFLRISFRLVLAAFLFSVSLTFIYWVLPVPFTSLMIWRVTENLIAGRPVHLERNWVSLDHISPKIVYAVIAAEDMKFFEHRGFDWEAIDKALRSNEAGGRVRGASTISQQVAKNVFLWPDRSWVRKSLEAYFTCAIELVWSKKRIIEVYLNVVELGDGIYGVGAATRKYFHKTPNRVTAGEAAMLAAVLPNPLRFQIDHPTPYVRFRRTMIQKRMPSAAETAPENRTEE